MEISECQIKQKLEHTYNYYYKPRSSLVFFRGDFNAKVGTENGNESFIGKYGKGLRNYNEKILVEFLLQYNNLYLANTHFTQSMRHISTWVGHIAGKKFYNQIFYIIIYYFFIYFYLFMADL